MFCIFCGKNLNPGTKFCSYCGKELPASKETGMPAAPSASAPSAAAPSAVAPSAAAPAPMPAAPSQPVQAAPPVFAAARPAEAAPVQSAKTPKPAKKTGRALLFGLIGVVLGAALLAGVLFFTGMISFRGAKSGGTSGARIEGPGFDTPEDAAKAYLEALKNQDVDAMVATFAVESYAEHYDLQAMFERLQAYTPGLEMKLPAGSTYNNELNAEGRRAFLLNQILYQYFLYNVPSANMESTSILTDNPNLISDMEKDTKDYVFSDLKITGTMAPEELTDLYLSDDNQENIGKQVKAYGVESKDIANVVITFEADGDTWYFCPQMICYDGKWYIQTLTGNLASILGWQPSYGGLARAS